MTPIAAGDDVLRRYLLGRLSPEARESVEQRIFSDDQVFWERLCLEEEQLIDEYAAGQLDEAARADFERHFLCTDERRTKLAFVRALREHVAREGSKARSAWDWLRLPVAAPRWALVAAATVMLAVPTAVWRFAGAGGPRTEVSTWLSTELVRAGGEVARVRIPASGCQLIRLHMDLGSIDYPFYRATLHEVTGGEVWAQGQLKASRIDGRDGVAVTLPCDLLPEGDYHVRLHGLPPDGAPVRLHRYDVRVLRE
jgi:hypothetical protein